MYYFDKSAVEIAFAESILHTKFFRNALNKSHK